MREDPRCPSCGEKVSATARWCMHCGADFDAPTDANASRGGELTILGIGEESDEREPDPWDAESATGVVETDTGTVDTYAGTVDTDTGVVGSGSAPAETRADPGSLGSAGRSGGTGVTGALAAPLRAFVAYLGSTEDRRQGFLLAYVFVLWLVLNPVVGAGLGTLFLLGLVGLGAYLYSRDSAADTLVASAYGTGVLLLALRALATVDVATDAGLSAWVDALLASPGWLAAAGAFLLAGFVLARLPIGR